MAFFAGGEAKSNKKDDTANESDLLPPAGLVVKRTTKSVCTRSVATRSKTERKK